MSKRNLARNTTLLVSSAVSAVWSDPLDYLSKVTQRLPRSIVRILRMFLNLGRPGACRSAYVFWLDGRSEEHTSELQSRGHLVCRLLLEKKKRAKYIALSTVEALAGLR